MFIWIFDVDDQEMLKLSESVCRVNTLLLDFVIATLKNTKVLLPPKLTIEFDAIEAPLLHTEITQSIEDALNERTVE